MQAKLDSIKREHGDAYTEGIQLHFDILKAHHFDSSWIWVRQDALLMYYDIIFGRLTTVDREITTSKRYEMMFLNCSPLSKLYPKSAQTRRTVLSLYEGVVRSLNNPDSNPVPLVTAVHPSSSFDHKLLVSKKLDLRNSGWPYGTHQHCRS